MSDTPDNPFQSPASVDHPDQNPAYAGLPGAGEKRPISPMVFGVLSLVFGVLGVLGAIIGLVAFAVMESQLQSEAMPFSIGYLRATQVLGLGMSVLLIVAGSLLVLHKKRGRVLFNVYACISLVIQVLTVGYILMLASTSLGSDPAATSGLIGQAIGNAVGLILPVLGLMLLNRPAVKQSLS
ncbi:MAG: hypothetical protein AAF790_01445 [Planctomycetota bacterium]